MTALPSSVCRASGSVTMSWSPPMRAAPVTSRGAERSKVAGAGPAQPATTSAAASSAQAPGRTEPPKGAADDLRFMSATTVGWQSRLAAEDELLGVALDAAQDAVDLVQGAPPLVGQRLVVAQAGAGETVDAGRDLGRALVEIVGEHADGAGRLGHLLEGALA